MTKSAVPKNTKQRKSTNVPGQFYGYSLQITRVVAHLLRAQQGQSISIEHFDDVATSTQNGVVVEQDKSGLAHNPVADRSIELWKTLHNWVRSIRDGALQSDTKFILYVAQGHHGSVVDRINSVTSKPDADRLVLQLREEFWGKAPKYAKRKELPGNLAEHVNGFLGASSEVISLLMVNLTLENGSGAPNDDLAAMSGMAAISNDKKDDVLKYLLGWAKRTVDKRLEQRQAPILTWDEFQKELVKAAKKFDRGNTLTASSVEITQADLQKELRNRTYIRQLEAVKCEDVDLIQAVNDYLRSAVHRTAWSEKGDIIESSFGEFEDGIDRAWRSQRSVINIEQKALAEEERGRLLFSKCQQLKVPLQGMEVPNFFVPGSLHSMADALRIGWHPRYQEMTSNSINQPAGNLAEMTTAPEKRSIEPADHIRSSPNSLATSVSAPDNIAQGGQA